MFFNLEAEGDFDGDAGCENENVLRPKEKKLVGHDNHSERIR